MFGKLTKSHIPEDFLSFARRIGYRNPSRLEQRVVPLILQGKDLIIETTGIDEVTNAFLLSLFGERREQAAGTSTIILATTAESVKKYARQLKTLATPATRVPIAAHIGVDDNIRREVPIVGKGVELVVATPERLIDHLRRDNISLSDVKRVLVDLPADFEELAVDKDLQFIYSKLPSRVQTVVACPGDVESGPLGAILRRPTTVKLADDSAPSFSLYIADRDEEKLQLLSDILFAECLESALVVCRGPAAAKAAQKHLELEGIAALCLLAGSTERDKEVARKELETGYRRVAVTDAAAGDPSIPRLANLVLFQAPESTEDLSRLTAGFTEMDSRSRIFVLVSKEESGALKKIQEVQHVDTTVNPSQDDVLRGRIAGIVKRIRESEDPAELNKYRKVIRKHVPLFLRGYFAAFVLKESLGKQSSVTVPQGDMKTLFVSIGKNRKVFPRDLSRLFSSVLKIKSSMIGSIKVLDNYSFIDIPESAAEKAISLLDGSDFRGRKITVNHARKREEKEE